MGKYKKLTKKDIILILKGNSEFRNCIIEKINFQFVPPVNNAKFNNCCFVDCSFNKTTFFNVEFNGIEFNHCNFADSEISNINFFKCTFINCDFSLSTIFSVKFLFCKFCAMYFCDCILKNIIFRNIDFYNIVHFNGSYLSENKFVKCNIKSGKAIFLNVKYGNNNQFIESSIEPIYRIDEKFIILLTEYKNKKYNNENK